MFKNSPASVLSFKITCVLSRVFYFLHVLICPDSISGSGTLIPRIKPLVANLEPLLQRSKITCNSLESNSVSYGLYIIELSGT